jgi:large subunit ribosomal protein L10e
MKYVLFDVLFSKSVINAEAITLSHDISKFKGITMGRKPNRMYRDIRGQSYTKREYMGGVPAMRITQFDLGNINGDFPLTITLKGKESCQIRDNALEAARIAAVRYLNKRAGVINYHLKVNIYPHNVLRENKQATGAGADRVSDGMRKAFGKAVGSAARIEGGQRLISIRTTKPYFVVAKEALRKASMKLPTPCEIVIEKGLDLVS